MHGTCFAGAKAIRIRAQGRADERVESRVVRETGQGGGAFTRIAMWVRVLGNGYVVAKIAVAVAVMKSAASSCVRTDAIAIAAGVAGAGGEDGDGGGTSVVGARRIGVVLATRVHGLDDGLSIRAVVRLDCGRHSCGIRAQDGGWVGNSAQIGTLSYMKEGMT